MWLKFLLLLLATSCSAINWTKLFGGASSFFGVKVLPEASFDEIDVNHDGVIDKNEAILFADTHGYSRQKANMAFSQGDTDGDNKITLLEFNALATAYGVEPSESHQHQEHLRTAELSPDS